MRKTTIVIILCVLTLISVDVIFAVSNDGTGPAGIVFPCEYVGNIDRSDFPEPSGIVYHRERGTLFVVSDEGHVAEFSAQGNLIKRAALSRDCSRIGGHDFEGITYNPATGLLYIAVEGKERIVEVSPEDFSVSRVFDVDRSFEGRTLLKRGGQGVEAITFVPDSTNPEGGLFYLANQAFSLEEEEDPSVIVQVSVPLRNGRDGDDVPIVGRFFPGIIDIAGFHYDPDTGHIFVLSDASNSLHEMTSDGTVLHGWAFPGKDQEGVTSDGRGTWYITQDCGGIIRLTEKGSAAEAGLVPVPRWSLAGPFDTARVQMDILLDAPPREAFNDRPVASDGDEAFWRVVETNSRGRLDIAEVLGRESNKIAYATFIVYSPSAQTVEALFSVNDQATLTLNGQPVNDGFTYELRHGEADVRLELQNGWNTVMARVLNLGAAWWIRMRLRDPEGQLRFTETPE